MTKQKEFSSPKITDLSWGRIHVESLNQTFKDAKLHPDGGREWDWKETGTEHVPGIQPADVEELLDHGAKIIILSRGMWNRLHVCAETLDKLKQDGLEVHVLETKKAVNLYNELAGKKAVGALIHSTC